MKNLTYFVMSVLLAAFALGMTANTAMAGDVAPSYVRIRAYTNCSRKTRTFRVIMATWKPGQRDKWHSHAGAATSYRLTDSNDASSYPRR